MGELHTSVVDDVGNRVSVEAVQRKVARRWSDIALSPEEQRQLAEALRMRFPVGELPPGLEALWQWAHNR